MVDMLQEFRNHTTRIHGALTGVFGIRWGQKEGKRGYLDEMDKRKSPLQRETISSVFVTGAKTVQSRHQGNKVQSTLKQYFTRGICLKLEELFFPLFPLFPDFSAFISSVKTDAVVFMARCDTSSVSFQEDPKGAEERERGVRAVKERCLV